MFFSLAGNLNSLAIDGVCGQTHLPHATFSHAQSLHSTDDMWFKAQVVKFELRSSHFSHASWLTLCCTRHWAPTSPVLFSSTSPTPGRLSTHPLIHCEDPRQDGTSSEYQHLTWTNLLVLSLSGPELVTIAWHVWSHTIITHVNSNHIVMWEIQHNNADWTVSGLPFCRRSRDSQSASGGLDVQETYTSLTQLNGSWSHFSWCRFTHGWNSRAWSLGVCL